MRIFFDIPKDKTNSLSSSWAPSLVYPLKNGTWVVVERERAICSQLRPASPLVLGAQVGFTVDLVQGFIMGPPNPRSSRKEVPQGTV